MQLCLLLEVLVVEVVLTARYISIYFYNNPNNRNSQRNDPYLLILAQHSNKANSRYNRNSPKIKITL
jgi:hypothetical protein